MFGHIQTQVECTKPLKPTELLKPKHDYFGVNVCQANESQIKMEPESNNPSNTFKCLFGSQNSYTRQLSAVQWKTS